MVKSFSELLGSGEPIRLMTWARRSASPSPNRFLYEFSETSGSTPVALDVAFWTNLGGSSPVVANSAATGAGGSLVFLDAYNQTTTTASPASLETVTISITQLILADDAVRIHMHLPASSPNTNSGITVKLTTDATTEYTIDLLDHGSVVASATWPLYLGNPTLELKVVTTSSNLVKASLNGDVVLSHQLTSYARSGDLAGFGLLQTAGVQLVQPRIDWFAYDFTPTAATEFPSEGLIASSAGIIYRELTDHTLENVADNGTSIPLASDVRIHAQPYLETSIIADYGIRHERLSKNIAATITSGGSGICTLDDTAISGGDGWDSLLIDADGDVLEIVDITNTAGALQVRSYDITGVHDTNGVTFAAPTGTHTASAVAYRILRYIKVYDTGSNVVSRHVSGSLQLDGTDVDVSSSAPAGCKSVSLWAGRIVYCNNMLAPQGWWMSAIGYPYLFDYGDTGLVGENGLTTDAVLLSLGSAAAVNGSQSEFAGLLGEPIVTAIPITDDILIFACKTSFYYLLGNPRDGGRINNITKDVGIVGIDAWCRDSSGRLFTLTQDGLYEITTDRATPLSRDMVPQSLLNVSADDNEVSLSYNIPRREVEIHVSSKEFGL
jgi:hypothetical protein